MSEAAGARRRTARAEVAETSPLAKALKGSCPRCGQGPLFKGWVRFEPRCRACSLDFDSFNVGDGPAAFLILIVCLIRAYKGDFTPKHHFGFEAAAWYWHFVDVVWLFLFVSIYVWGGWGAPTHGG